ncbi:uncharacterized protein LOC130142561 isoform X2 [Falco biarmicus]|uniref:uncharacterized protein LOC130142561 isoform X2 n=1 Tax=Falco biarmicus TaxID=345155 RepID=UPI0024BC18C9|nr:uncharacterized protein LOC130142561 isoform X2 [Falco biarmicus]
MAGTVQRAKAAAPAGGLCAAALPSGAAEGRACSGHLEPPPGAGTGDSLFAWKDWLLLRGHGTTHHRSVQLLLLEAKEGSAGTTGWSVALTLKVPFQEDGCTTLVCEGVKCRAERQEINITSFMQAI